MRQKIQIFRQQLRRNEMNKFFQAKREQLLASTSQGREVTLLISQESKLKRQIMIHDEEEMDVERKGMEVEEEGKIQIRLNSTENELNALRQNRQWNQIVKLLDEIYLDLKRINSSKVNTNRRAQLMTLFLMKSTLMTVVSLLNEAFCSDLQRGLLQSLSIRATKILFISIRQRLSDFSEDVYLNSNILSFLRCAIQEPKYDYSHMSRICFIMDQMITVSSNKLFEVLNARGSKFHIGAVFFNISKMKLYPQEQLTQNFIAMVKNYLSRVEDQILEFRSKNKSKKDEDKLLGLNFTCLTPDEIEIALEIALIAFRESGLPSFQESNEKICLWEVLEVIRLIIQNFKVKQTYKSKLEFRKIMNLLSLRDCIGEVKESLLSILDHLIYEDQDGEIGFRLLGQYNMTEVLWQLKQDYPNFVMNLMCNLALEPKLKQFLRERNHNIFLQLKFESNQFLLRYVYNWFYSQKFEITDSMEKVMLQSLSEMEDVDSGNVDLFCMLWLNLGRHNQIHIPSFVLNLQSYVVKMIKEELLGEPQQESI